MERYFRKQPLASSLSTENWLIQHGKRLLHWFQQAPFFTQRPQGRTSAYRPTRRSRKNGNSVTDPLSPPPSSLPGALSVYTIYHTYYMVPGLLRYNTSILGSPISSIYHIELYTGAPLPRALTGRIYGLKGYLWLPSDSFFIHMDVPPLDTIATGLTLKKLPTCFSYLFAHLRKPR
ncbi:uncharacterized protein LOC143793887 isoform X2 [Ranitomeya variabilis]|uniref:uncharacterized protein LOC143793887 isoform X2 n=1 Tax=Ranitomeya variabilis TaxID=490064 RepID=UPI0040561241